VARDAAARHPVSVALLRIFVYITLQIFLFLWGFRSDGRNVFHVSVLFSIFFFFKIHCGLEVRLGEVRLRKLGYAS